MKTDETHLRDPMVLSTRGTKSIVSILGYACDKDPNIRCLDSLLADGRTPHTDHTPLTMLLNSARLATIKANPVMVQM